MNWKDLIMGMLMGALVVNFAPAKAENLSTEARIIASAIVQAGKYVGYGAAMSNSQYYSRSGDDFRSVVGGF